MVTPWRLIKGAEPDALKGCAVSRTDGIATRGGRSSGFMTPRRTTDLDPKGQGDKSMLIKRGTTEDVYVVVLQRLSDRAKTALFESQSPGVEAAHSSVAHLSSDAIVSHGFDFCSWYTLRDGRCPTRAFKGINGEPTSF